MTSMTDSELTAPMLPTLGRPLHVPYRLLSVVYDHEYGNIIVCIMEDWTFVRIERLKGVRPTSRPAAQTESLEASPATVKLARAPNGGVYLLTRVPRNKQQVWMLYRCDGGTFRVTGRKELTRETLGYSPSLLPLDERGAHVMISGGDYVDDRAAKPVEERRCPKTIYIYDADLNCVAVPLILRGPMLSATSAVLASAPSPGMFLVNTFYAEDEHPVPSEETTANLLLCSFPFLAGIISAPFTSSDAVMPEVEITCNSFIQPAVHTTGELAPLQCGKGSDVYAHIHKYTAVTLIQLAHSPPSLPVNPPTIPAMNTGGGAADTNGAAQTTSASSASLTLNALAHWVPPRRLRAGTQPLRLLSYVTRGVLLVGYAGASGSASKRDRVDGSHLALVAAGSHVPWRRDWHAELSPPTFHAAVWTLAWLRVHSDRVLGDETEIDAAAVGRGEMPLVVLWRLLPVEVFEYLVAAMWEDLLAGAPCLNVR